MPYVIVRRMNIVDSLVSVFGSQEAVARIAGVKQPSVAEWKRRNSIPSRRVHKLLRHARDNNLDLEADDFFPSAAAEQARKDSAS